mgnify:FL=1
MNTASSLIVVLAKLKRTTMISRLFLFVTDVLKNYIETIYLKRETGSYKMDPIRGKNTLTRIRYMETLFNLFF